MERKILGDVKDLIKNKNVFHRVGGGGDKWFLKLDNGTYAVLPIAECCPIEILTYEEFEKDREEFKHVITSETSKVLQELEKRKQLLDTFDKEI